MDSRIAKAKALQGEPAGRPQERVYDSRALFGGDLQVFIDHGQERYVLRRTRQGKLILTK